MRKDKRNRGRIQKIGRLFWFFIPKIGRMQNNTYFCNVLFDVTIIK